MIGGQNAIQISMADNTAPSHHELLPGTDLQSYEQRDVPDSMDDEQRAIRVAGIRNFFGHSHTDSYIVD